MARGDVRIAVTLACEECKRRNYQTEKSKRNNPDRIEFRKYCRWCGSTRRTRRRDDRGGRATRAVALGDGWRATAAGQAAPGRAGAPSARRGGGAARAAPPSVPRGRADRGRRPRPRRRRRREELLREADLEVGAPPEDLGRTDETLEHSPLKDGDEADDLDEELEDYDFEDEEQPVDGASRPRDRAASAADARPARRRTTAIDHRVPHAVWAELQRVQWPNRKQLTHDDRRRSRRSS